MKNPFVKDLAADQTVTTFFLVHEKEVRNTAAGKSYLRMELGDRSGTVVDPFGHVWHVATHVEDVAPDEIQRRVAAMMSGTPPA